MCVCGRCVGGVWEVCVCVRLSLCGSPENVGSRDEAQFDLALHLTVAL